jgi:lysine 2,3-aminomutase
VTETLDEAVQAADGRALPQPYSYRHTPLVEPDWRRFPGWAEVTDE